MSQAAARRLPARFDASVLPDAKPASFPGFIEPCHPTLREEAPSGTCWIHEIKFDGYRMQAHLRNARPAIYTRRAYCAVGKKPAITRRFGSNWRISPESGSGRKRGVDGEET